MKINTTAIVYARVSTAKQADEGLPVESQIERGHQKATAIDADVVRVFTDAGISGRTDERPAFRDAVAYCKAYNVDYFICWSTSRFARNKLDAALYKRELEKHGTRVVYVSVDLDNRTDSGWMMESMMEIFDEHYSRQVSADTLRSMMKNAQDGFFNGGRPPFGYRAVPFGRRKRLSIEDAEASIVRDMFSMCIEGAGSKSISMSMNEKGRLNRGKPWAKTTVISLLKNHAYCGYIVFNRINRNTKKVRPQHEWIMTKSHEAIVSEDAFMEVQSLFGDRAPVEGAGSPHSRFVFTGLLRCAKCGATLQTESAKGRSTTYHYYNCSSAQRGKGCTNRRIPAHDLDRWMIENIMDRILTNERIAEIISDIHELTGEWVKDRARRRDSIVSEIRSTEARLKKLFEVLELHGKDAPNLSDLTERMRELKQQRNELERSLIQLEEEEIPGISMGAEEIAAMSALLREIVINTKDPRKQRLFFSSFIKNIVVGDKDISIEYQPEKLVNRSGFDTVHSKAIWLPERDLLRTIILTIPLPEKLNKLAA